MSSLSKESASLDLVLFGTGRMGQLITSVAQEAGHRVLLGLDSKNNADGLGLKRGEIQPGAVAIDFSRGDCVLSNLRSAAECGLDVVIGTTDWDRPEGARAEAEGIAADAGIGLITAPNFSLGVFLFLRLAREAAQLAGADPERDTWIEETHHVGKVDHPSGTALRLAEEVLAVHPGKTSLRTSLRGAPPEASELGVFSMRGGHQPGLHRLVMDGPDDTIELQHVARSRSGFARGAVRAASWVKGRKGSFELADMLDELVPARDHERTE